MYFSFNYDKRGIGNVVGLKTNGLLSQLIEIWGVYFSYLKMRGLIFAGL